MIYTFQRIRASCFHALDRRPQAGRAFLRDMAAWMQGGEGGAPGLRRAGAVFDGLRQWPEALLSLFTGATSGRSSSAWRTDAEATGSGMRQRHSPSSQ